MARQCNSWFTRVSTPVVGRVILQKIRGEARRLEQGVTIEPRTFVERRNWAT